MASPASALILKNAVSPGAIGSGVSSTSFTVISPSPHVFQSKALAPVAARSERRKHAAALEYIEVPPPALAAFLGSVCLLGNEVI